MKKKFLTGILIFLILLSPISIYAESIVDTSEDFSQLTIDDSIVNFDDGYDYVPEVKQEYNPKEQEVLEGIPTIGCEAAYVADPASGKVFYEKNAHEIMYPASTTKILTALVVLENCKLTDTATVSKNAISLVPDGYSNANLKPGETFSILDLLYALLVPSANEAANVLAEHVSGSVEAFAELCNKRAKELGCENLHFVNPNGIHNDDHYCTAYDLYLIAKECQKFDTFKEIVKTAKYTVPATDIYPYDDRTYTNTNYMIVPTSWSYYYDYCTGIKTGHTTLAGECLVASSSRDNIDLITVVLGGGTNSQGYNERFYDTKQLMEFVYNNYSYKEIVSKKHIMATVNVEKATRETSSLDVIINSSIYAIVPNKQNMDEIETIVYLPDEVQAPVKQFQEMGKVTFKVDGLSYTTEMVASHTVEKIPYWLHNGIILGIILLVLFIISLIIKSSRKRKRKKLKARY